MISEHFAWREDISWNIQAGAGIEYQASPHYRSMKSHKEVTKT